MQNLSSLYEKLSEKYNVPVEAIQQIEQDFWLGVKKSIISNSAKDIMIKGLGRIYFDERSLLYEEKRYLYSLDLNEKLFKEGRRRWIDYLYKWRNINRALKEISEKKKFLEKRRNRKPHERGL